MSPDASFDQTVRTHLEDIRRELADLRHVLAGRPDFGQIGVLARIEASEKQIATLKDVQESFVRDRERDIDRREKRESARNRVQVAVLSTFGAMLVTIFAAVLKLLTATGGVVPGS